MEYKVEGKEDFKFYLLPSGAIFTKYLSKYKSENEVPKLTMGDIEELIDIAFNNRLLTESNVYIVRDQLISLIQNKEKSNDSNTLNKPRETVISVVDSLYKSHMGVSLLFDLYQYDYLVSLKSKLLESKEEDKEKVLEKLNLETTQQKGKVLELIKSNNSIVSKFFTNN